MYKDLRGFIKQVDELGALRLVNGADPKFELGGITEVAAGTAECPALLSDHIKGYGKGVRVFTMRRPRRSARRSRTASIPRSSRSMR
jgi:3-polyprenyl-4-hydroxybenzoate decarboxylase